LIEEDDEIAELWYLHGFSISEQDPEESLESLKKARDLLEKSGCHDESLFERIDQLFEVVNINLQNEQNKAENNDGISMDI